MSDKKVHEAGDKGLALWLMETGGAGLFGFWLAFSLLKFGNPVVLADKITAPEGFWQFVLNAWPVDWGYVILALVALFSLFRWSWPRTAPLRMVVLPAAWLFFQVLASLHTVDTALTSRTLLHFSSVAAAFYFGLCVFSKMQDARLFWVLFLGAFAQVLIVGFYQHFVGLEETRRYFFAYEIQNYPNGPPAELLKKLSSNRIYSTLFYPNTLAAVIILVTPPFLARIGFLHATRPARAVLLWP